jgi:hypothetical protein
VVDMSNATNPIPHPADAIAPTGPVDASGHPVDDADQAARVLRALRSRNFAMLATVSSAGFPHAAGVQYALAGSDTAPVLYTHTMRSSRKARNVAAEGRVGVVVPVRRLPVGPPFTLQFQARAEIVEMDSPEIAGLLAGGRLKEVSSHGELDEPDGCYLRIVPNGTIHTYGIGVSAIGVARDPLHVGARTVRLDA